MKILLICFTGNRGETTHYSKMAADTGQTANIELAFFPDVLRIAFGRQMNMKIFYL